MDINRKTAYCALIKIEKEDAYSNIALNLCINELKPDSPAFVRELVYGVLKNKVYLDHILDQIVTRGVKSVKKETKTILHMGLYQLIFMNSVPQYAAVNETVKLAMKYVVGREAFVNGVLRGYIRKKDQLVFPDENKNPVEYLSVKYSYAKWIVKQWIDQYGIEKAEELLKAGNETPALSLRTNISLITRDELKSRLAEQDIEVTDGRLSTRCIFAKGSDVLSTSEFKEGLFSVQDEASMVAMEMLEPEEGETIIDICAAPGGKTLATAELMNNTGKVISCDVYEHKLKLIEKEAERLKLNNIEVIENDGTVLREEWIETADRVIVDGPCSGLGVTRRKPEIKYRELADCGRELARKQLEILEISSKYVKKDGILLYSTCTVNKTENIDVVSRFLKHHDEFELVRSRQLLQGTDETDGFFICKMRKRNN